jgi:hypothetical protein
MLYRAKDHASEHEARSASNAVAQVFNRQALLGPDRYWGIIEYNPMVMVVITDEKNEMVGFFDVFPVRTPAAEKFLGGVLSEPQMLSKGSIYGPGECVNAKYLYIGTVLAVGANLSKSSKLCLEWSIIGVLYDYLQDRYPPTQGRVYFALASTKLGEKWLGLCGFEAKAVTGREGINESIYLLSSDHFEYARNAVRKITMRFSSHRFDIHSRW